VSVGWIVLAIGIAVGGLVFATSRRRREYDVDLGTVSHQWMAEQRLGQRHDPPR
jgi:hypothetical protein